jgi:hypothetical protein
MTKQIQGYSIYYPAPVPIPLMWMTTSKVLEENEEIARRQKGDVFEVRDKEYLLVQGFKIFHVLFDRDKGSCACPDWNNVSGEVTIPPPQIIAVRNKIANFQDQIKPLSKDLRDLVQKFCDREKIECKLPEITDSNDKMEEEITVVPPNTILPSSSKLIFACYSCKAGISAEQRSNSVKAHGKALCEVCAAKGNEKPIETKKVPPHSIGRDGKTYDIAGNKIPEKQEKDSQSSSTENSEKQPPILLSELNSEAKSKLGTHDKSKLPETKKLSDTELEEAIEKKKAERFLINRGSSYKVSGKERPDSHRIQNVANEKGICIEILEALQTDDYSHVVVRGHLGDQYVDAVVHHDFKTEFQLKVLEIVSKNPEILDHWEGTEPVIKQGAKIKVEEYGKTVLKDAKYFVVHALLSFKKFSLRDARTKAASIAEQMLLNRDWRDIEEQKSEESEKKLVEESIKNRQAAK